MAPFEFLEKTRAPRFGVWLPQRLDGNRLSRSSHDKNEGSELSKPNKILDPEDMLWLPTKKTDGQKREDFAF